MNMKDLSAIFVLFCFLGIARTAEPDGNACYGNQELSFFCDAKMYAYAKKACEDNDSYLVKFDSANMTEVVNALFAKANCSYKEDIFIGGTAAHHPNFPNDGSKRIWTWLDRSAIHMSKKYGYANWLPGQPNDFGGGEDCLILDKYAKQWKDTKCHDHKFYICQKKKTVNIYVDSISSGRRCVGSAGPCETHAEWRRGQENVSSDRSRTMYQTIGPSSSILHYENATIGDAGEYICVAWDGGNKANQSSIAVVILVNGTPEIINIKAFICNNSLQVSWKPHFRSVGFLHRIVAISTQTRKLAKVLEVTPNETATHLTEVSGLEPSTKYYVKVVACKEVNNCSDEHSTDGTATTFGVIITVTNPRIHQSNATGNDTCILTWQWLHNISAIYLVKVHWSSAKTRDVSKTEQILIKYSNNYSFVTIPEHKYYVEIQPVVTYEKYCPKPVKAVGLCVGIKLVEVSDKAAEGSTAISTVTVISATVPVIVFLLVVSAIALILYKKNRATESLNQSTTSESQDHHDYATVKNPEINDAGYFDIPNSPGSSAPIYHYVADVRKTVNHSYENIDARKQTSSPTYETIAKQDMSVYEM